MRADPLCPFFLELPLMTTIQPTELTCEIRTNLIRDDASPFDFKFEVTCIDEASEENEYSAVLSAS